jgi:hypothetical protein
MKRLLPIAFLAASAYGQVSAPDCIASFTLSASGPSTGFPNQGCIFWNLTYKNFGFSGLSLTLQQAPDNNNVPGTWKTFAGTGEVGSNPSTSTTGAYFTVIASDTDLAAWVRVNLSGLTGTGFVTGYVYGYKTYPGASGGGGGGSGCTAPCVVIGPDATGGAPSQAPVQIATTDGSGNVVRPMYCSLSAPISVSGSGLTQIVALTGGKRIEICNISVSFASGVDFQLETGTGSNCAGATTALTGVYKTVLTVALDFTSGTLNGVVSQALCINLGAGVTGGGVVNYGLR